MYLKLGNLSQELGKPASELMELIWNTFCWKGVVFYLYVNKTRPPLNKNKNICKYHYKLLQKCFFRGYQVVRKKRNCMMLNLRHKLQISNKYNHCFPSSLIPPTTDGWLIIIVEIFIFVVIILQTGLFRNVITLEYSQVTHVLAYNRSKSCLITV